MKREGISFACAAMLALAGCSTSSNQHAPSVSTCLGDPDQPGVCPDASSDGGGGGVDASTTGGQADAAEPPCTPGVTTRDPALLWPPNHRYHHFALGDCIETVTTCPPGGSGGGAAGSIVAICSDEPENTTGDGNTTQDIVLVDADHFDVRSERRGDSNGRVYTVTFTVAGVPGLQTCHIGVPHDQSGRPPVDDGCGAGYTVTP
jgi:hypothetical protein